MHTTMQTLGRVAVGGGGILVSVVNIVMFSGVNAMTGAEKAAVYINIYRWRSLFRWCRCSGFFRHDFAADHVPQTAPSWFHQRTCQRTARPPGESVHANRWLLGGSLVYAVFTLIMGFGGIPFDQEMFFPVPWRSLCFSWRRLRRIDSGGSAVRWWGPPSSSSCFARCRDRGAGCYLVADR